MRLSLLGASAAIVFGLALSACSGSTGSSPAVPSSGSAMTRHGHGLVTRLMPGVKELTGIGCDYSEYSFCFYVTPGDSGPYVESETGSKYELYNAAYIDSNKKGKLDKKFSTYFSPDPGNPTYQYITYKGKNPKKATAVKFTDYYCIGFSASYCTGSNYTLKLGIAISPAT